MKRIINFAIACMFAQTSLGQQISGTVFEVNSEIPVEYANIGIFGKNTGTCSDQNGKYTLQINPEHHSDTLIFSCIGYHTYSVKVSDFINQNNGNVSLEKRTYDISEVVIRPRKIKQKELGNTPRNQIMIVCFPLKNYQGGGYELGVLMSNKKTAFIKEVNLDVERCTYDTVFLRINIYQVHKKRKNEFENILSSPIYLNLSKEEVKDKITVDLRHLNLVVEGDFLVTIEYVKDLGTGKICFRSGLLFAGTSYGRSTSHGTWGKWPVGIGLSAEVDVEK